MKGQSQFQDKFSEYLSRRLNPSQATSIIYGSQSQNSNQNHQYLSPTQSHYNRTQNSPYNESSINSSQLLSSQYSKISQKSKQFQTQSIKRGRLRKLRDIEQNICSICLQPYKNRVEMSCKHSYCKQCLEEWLKTSSKCPYCRADCQFYYHNGNQYRIEQKQFDYEEEDNGDGQFNFQCYMCEQSTEGDEILVCDGCELYACHERCDPRLRTRRLGRNQLWYCHFC